MFCEDLDAKFASVRFVETCGEGPTDFLYPTEFSGCVVLVDVEDKVNIGDVLVVEYRSGLSAQRPVHVQQGKILAQYIETALG